MDADDWFSASHKRETVQSKTENSDNYNATVANQELVSLLKIQEMIC